MIGGPRLHHQLIRQKPFESRKSCYSADFRDFSFLLHPARDEEVRKLLVPFPEKGAIYWKKVPLKVPPYGSLKMATKTHSLELTIRNVKGVKGEVQVIRCGAGLEMWISVNQAGNTMKNRV